MNTRENPAVALARRLRGLREYAWPDISVTQKDLARALGGSRPLSVPLISSWENSQRPVVPPADRLLAYAAFFASRRSVESRPYRSIEDADLTSEEREHRDRLERELMNARSEAVQFLETATTTVPTGQLDGPWWFEDGKPITIVCAPVPVEQLEALPEPDDPNRAYAALHSYADADSLLELYGHIRAANPFSEVHFKKASELVPDDYTTHVVLLGGSDWNQATRSLIAMLDLPVSQEPTLKRNSRLPSMYVVDVPSGGIEEFHPQWDSSDGHLVNDIGHFVRAPNPLNGKRTLTICNGIESRGVLGMVRALVDERFRDRNNAYLKKRFAGRDKYSLLTRIRIVDGAVMTPDWNFDSTRLHEWPQSS